MANPWRYEAIPDAVLDILTECQRECVLAMAKNGNSSADAARSIGRPRSTLRNHLKYAKVKMRRHGYDQENESELLFDSPHFVKGRSAFYQIDTETGERQLVREWVKTDTEKENRADSLKEFVESLKEEIPRIPKTPLPKGRKWDSDLMAAIVIGDAHIGMYAYGVETKQRDFDTNSSSLEIMTAINDLVERAPNAETGLLVNVGDFLHSDTSRGETWSGTRLDNDTRRKLVIKTAKDTLRYGIERMLDKFKKVIVVNARGNHDDNSAWALSEIIETAYENEPRVDVLPTEGYFHHIEFGKWFIAVHHGDKVKAPKLVSALARDYPEVWGRTTSRIWMVGHIHHQSAIEIDGCIVRSFGTLAPADSWHSSMGYGSDCVMELLTFKKGGGMHSTLIHSIPRETPEPDITVK